jgi:hypothetical protein
MLFCPPFYEQAHKTACQLSSHSSKSQAVKPKNQEKTAALVLQRLVKLKGKQKPACAF